MTLNLKFRFNSGALIGYFFISALGFLSIFTMILTISGKAERIASIKHDVFLIMGGISGSILGTAELDSQGLQDQSQSLMQEYLDFTFDSKKNQIQNRVAKVEVYFLNPDKQLVGEWKSSQIIHSECLEKRTEYFQPGKSVYPYLVVLTVNICINNSFGLFEYHSVLFPILILLAILFIWGICIFAMLRSVRYAGKLLEQCENVDELIEKTKKINWVNVRVLAQKAVQLQGKNLQFFLNLILDAQHDITKVLDTIDRNYKEKNLQQNVSAIRGIIQKLSIELRSSNEYPEISLYKEVDYSEISDFIKTYFQGNKIHNLLPISCKIPINDITIFERVIVNLASNAKKHGKYNSFVKIYYEDYLVFFEVYTPVSRAVSVKLHLAKWTKRLDITNPDSPVYFKLVGRNGRGSSIIKRGIIKLGGRMIFMINKNVVQSGFSIPAKLSKQNHNLQNKYPTKRKRVIYFYNEEFRNLCIKYGLEKYLVSKEEFVELLNNDSMEDFLEVVSDQDVQNFPKTFLLKIITKKERIEGLALNWVGELKI